MSKITKLKNIEKKYVKNYLKTNAQNLYTFEWQQNVSFSLGTRLIVRELYLRKSCCERLSLC